MEYQTIPGVVGVVVTSKLATLYELQTVYSYEDMLSLYEIHLTNIYNEKKAWEVKK